MTKLHVAAGLLLATLALAGCGHDNDNGGPAAAATSAMTPRGVDHPMAPSTAPPPGAAQQAPAAAATTASYQIPPFPLSNVAICDRYASEARRCLNQFGTDPQRHAFEDSISKLLKKVTPEKPGQAPNEWETVNCRRGLETLSVRFKQCSVQP